MKSVGVALQVRIIVTVNASMVELIDRFPPGFAEEQLLYRTIHDCAHSAFRFTDIDRFVTMSVVHFIESVAQLRGRDASDRRHDGRLRRCALNPVA